MTKEELNDTDTNDLFEDALGNIGVGNVLVDVESGEKITAYAADQAGIPFIFPKDKCLGEVG